jgi:hypothetical protein
LSPGVNTLHGIAPDGSDAIAVLGWRDNGNAWDYHAILFLTRPKPGGRWEVAGLEQPGGSPPFADSITDIPHTFEDAVRSVRLARGTVDGVPATLLLIATRLLEPDLPVPAATHVLYESFRLVRKIDGEVGYPSDYFHRIEAVRSTDLACDAEMALARHFDIPLPRDHVGSGRADGCAD